MVATREEKFCWVSHKSRLLFISIPKNASSSIRKSEIFGKDMRRHNYDTLLKSHPQIVNYTKFTVLRNPMTRAISGFMQVCEGNNKRNPYNKVGKRPFAFLDGFVNKFELYLEDVLLKEDFFDPHIKPQIYFLTDEKGNEIKLDYYLFFERIVDDYILFCKEIGLMKDGGKITMPHLNCKKDSSPD